MVLGLLVTSTSVVAVLSVGGSEVPGSEQPPPQASATDLAHTGDAHRAANEHDQAIEAYAAAYRLYEAERQSWRRNHPLVKALGESCEAVIASDTPAAQSLYDCAAVIGNHTREIGGDDRRHRQKYEHDKTRLDELLVSIEDARTTKPSPPPEPVDPNVELPVSTPSPEPGPSKPPLPSGPFPETVAAIEAQQVREETRPQLVLASIGIAGGSLLTLTGTALMLNGAAWTRCSRDYRINLNGPSNRCLELLGAISGLDVTQSTVLEPQEYATAADYSRFSSVRYWVLGSMTLAAGATLIVGSAIGIHRIRKKRERFSLAGAWSRRSALASVTVRF